MASEKKTNHPFLPVILFALLLAVSYLLFRSDTILSAARQYMDRSVAGAAVYVLVLVLATICAPVSAVPLMPLAAHIFGPFLAALYSVLGWFIGAIVAFFIARFLGERVLSYFVSKKTLERYRAFIPSQHYFVATIMLRMMIPVDFLSYALGLFTAIPFGTYALATLIGIIPFAFIYSYGGEALFAGDLAAFMLVALFGAILAFIVYFMYSRYKKYKQ